MNINAKYADEFPLFIREMKPIDADDPSAVIKPITTPLYYEPTEILCITSYPPVECGIATYSYDLIKAVSNKFNNTFSVSICALQKGIGVLDYPKEVKYILNTEEEKDYKRLANNINADQGIRIVLVQHEFGFFLNGKDTNFLSFLLLLNKPIVISFHTVLPMPDDKLKAKVIALTTISRSVIVMTHISAQILIDEYGINSEKINVIAHGTHLVLHIDKQLLKLKYKLNGRKVLSTFGLLSSGKSIETTLEALPSIVLTNPEVIFLVIGKTHPGVVTVEGESYRSMLEAKVIELQMQDHVLFINRYLPLKDLLEYLQLTDIYLFTSKDPNQAVSGTFAYAMSCACPIISTPIPHALEVLRDDTGIIIDFRNVEQLSNAVHHLLGDEALLNQFTTNTLERIVPTTWENSAIAHAGLFSKLSSRDIVLQYSLPEVNLTHIKKMTTALGMIQFSNFNQPDLGSGFTLDDNARALIAVCMHFEITRDENDLRYLRIYLDFINYCQQCNGRFLNYVDEVKEFTQQNDQTNLEDSNGRAIWALGYLISQGSRLPIRLITEAEAIMQRALPSLQLMHSPRAMAFSIKGLYYYNRKVKAPVIRLLIGTLADRLEQMFKHESEYKWSWFESYLTYANSILSEAMLCAWLENGKNSYKEIAKVSFDFLLSQTFTDNGIKLISNKCWLKKGKYTESFGEQPIDVAYTILSLRRFYKAFRNEGYKQKMEIAFSWFLGNNHLHHIIYNPCTGGCYDGLEETHVNLNQGAESTLSYLMARLTIEKQESENLA